MAKITKNQYLVAVKGLKPDGRDMEPKDYIRIVKGGRKMLQLYAMGLTKYDVVDINGQSKKVKTTDGATGIKNVNIFDGTADKKVFDLIADEIMNERFTPNSVDPTMCTLTDLVLVGSFVPMKYPGGKAMKCYKINEKGEIIDWETIRNKREGKKIVPKASVALSFHSTLFLHGDEIDQAGGDDTETSVALSTKFKAECDRISEYDRWAQLENKGEASGVEDLDAELAQAAKAEPPAVEVK